MKNICLLILSLSFSCLTIFSRGQTVLTLQPGPDDGIDTYICTVFPYEPGYNKPMLVTAWTYGGEPYLGKNVFKFDLSQIPAQSIILDARLSLYFDIYGSWDEHVPPNESYIKKVTSDWDEMTVCWANQPTTTTDGKIDLPATTLPQQDLIDIDVKHFVTGWVSNPSENFGMLIGLYNETPYACLLLISSDGTIPEKRPKLIVTYLECDLPDANFSFNVNGLTVNFQDSSTSVQIWNWNFGDGSTSLLQDPIHAYSNPGKYQVCLTVNDSCGSDLFCDTVEVICNNPIAQWSYTNAGTMVHFFDSTSNASSWFWDFGDGYSSYLKNPVHQYEAEGNYYVCLTVEDSCGSDVYCDTVRTCNPLLAMFSNQTQGHFVIFADSSEQAMSWYWDFGDGFMSVLENPVHYYQNLGNYFVCLTVDNNCETGIYCDSVNVIPNSVGELPIDGLKLFPNPVKDFLIIQSPRSNDKNILFIISNNRGEVVVEYLLQGSNETRLDMSSLEPGLYFIRIISGENVRASKFIKTE